jgi:hypothetical protein
MPSRLRPPPPLLFVLLLATLWCAAGQSRPAGAADDEEDPRALDYEFFRVRIEPFLLETCGECHADPRERRKVGRHFLRPAPGRRLREKHSRQNFETVSALVEPRNPAASLYLLKPLDPRDGGLTHKGGTRLNTNTPEYGAIVDWINGAKLPEQRWKPPTTEPGQPDFKYYVAHISPVLQSVCAECHAGKGQGRFGFAVPSRENPLDVRGQYANFEKVLKLLSPGRPKRSRLLMKPLAMDAGGFRHKGGDRIQEGDETYVHFKAFIEGEPGPELPREGPAPVPVLTPDGLVLQAEDLDASGAYEELVGEGAEDAAVGAGEGQLTVFAPLRVTDPGTYRLRIRARQGLLPLRMRMGRMPWIELAPHAESAEQDDGWVEIGPRTLCDGIRPLQDVDGNLRVNGHIIDMDAAGRRARWLSPENETPYEQIEAAFTMPDDEGGGVDALLLFDCLDADNGKFVGLMDGGRRFVMGLIEGGRLRVIDSRQARLAPDEEVHKLGVRFMAGVAVGVLDGNAQGHMVLDEKLGQGLFGFQTHGKAEVHHLFLHEQFEVYRVKPRVQPIVEMPRGAYRLEFEVQPDGGWLDAIRIEPATE